MSELQLPIEHLSYSSLKQLVSNSWLFKKRYLLGLYEDQSGPSLVVGKAFHKFAELHYKGESYDKANLYAIKHIDETPDSKIKYGSTQSRESMLRELNNAITHFINYEPNIGTVLGVEARITTEFDVDGMTAPLPVKAVSDLVTEIDGKIHIWDWKTCDKFTPVDVENPQFILQAMFNYFTVRSKYGEPEAMHFFEVRKNNPRSGDPISTYSIEYEKHPEYMTLFLKMYEGAIRLLVNPDMVFLPNFSDLLGAEESWTDFVSETFDFNMPKQVTHRSSAIKNVDMQFVQSKVELANTDEDRIVAKMLEFGIALEPVDNHKGASVTLHRFKPSRGVRMNKIESMEADIAQALGAKSVRMMAPIKGTQYIGVEISNEKQEVIPWTTDLMSRESSLMIPIGQDVYSKPYHVDLAKAPHLLVAGSTGSGKSVFLNTLIHTLTEQNTPEDLKLILIDPKMTEFNAYAFDEHLETEIISEVKEASFVLEWLVKEMNDRYEELRRLKAKNVDEVPTIGRLVVVIDELADMLLNSESYDAGNGKQVRYADVAESNILRLLQKSRAAGIHLVLATQRPSVDVLKGTLKANLPTRVAFMTSSRADSQVILDQSGAETLLGNGDLLLMNPRERGLVRLQGFYL